MEIPQTGPQVRHPSFGSHHHAILVCGVHRALGVHQRTFHVRGQPMQERGGGVCLWCFQLVSPVAESGSDREHC